MSADRWVLNRAGILNFWYYDEEEFHFADGKLLLRGANSSGKSVTMQSLIPILLDGRKSPDRLDPFGSRSRRMEDYLLGEKELVEREERTGYLYLEYKKRESSQYITTGIGLQARRYGRLNFWGFVINDNRRIGRDLELYRVERGGGGEKVKIPLARSELEARIGQGGRVVRSQKGYMELVNRQVFGFATEEAFEDLIKLIIQLRSPKLSKDFKPTVIYEILNESLPPLTDEELRPLSDTIENMDQTRQQLEQLRRDRAAVQRLCRQYDQYNRFMLAEKARGLIGAQSKLKRQEQAAAAAAARHAALLARMAELEEQLARLRTESVLLSGEKKTLARHEVFNIEEEKGEVKQALAELERLRQQKDENRREKEGIGAEFRRRIERKEKERDQCAEKSGAVLKQLDSEAKGAQFAAHEAASRDYLKSSGEAYHFGLWKEEAGAYLELLQGVLEILQQVGRARERYQEADRELGERRRELDQQRRKEKEWAGLFEEERDRLTGAIHRWREGNRECLLPDDELTILLARVNVLFEETAWEEVREPLERSYRKLRRSLEAALLQLEHALKQKEREIEDKKAELKYWQEKKDPEPPRHADTGAARRRLEQQGIPHLPFFAAVEFHGAVALPVRERLEGALREMGLLDALILPEQFASTVPSDDRVIKAGPPQRGETLADYLYPTPAAGVAVASEDIAAVLRGIKVAGTAEAGAPALDREGRYHLSLLLGHAPVSEQPQFIGREARRRYRESEIERLAGELGSLEEDRTALKVDCNNLGGRCEALDHEYGAFPSAKDTGEAFRLYEEAGRQAAFLTREVEKKDIRVQELLAELRELAARARTAAADLPFEAVEENCREALFGMERYRSGLHALELNHKDLLGILSMLEEIKGSLAHTEADIEELRRESKALGVQEEIKRSQLDLLERKLMQLGAAGIRERIEQVEKRLQLLPSEIEALVGEKGSLRHERTQIEQEKEQLGQGLGEYRDLAAGWQNIFLKELQLELALREGKPTELSTPADALKLARKAAHELAGVLVDGAQEKAFAGLTRVFYQEQGALAEYRPTLDDYRVEEPVRESEHPTVGELSLLYEALERAASRLLLLLEYDGKRLNPYTVLERMEQDLGLQEQLLSEKDRELYEEIITYNVGRVIRGRISRAERWVKQIDALMAQRKTSGALTFSLSWRPGTARREDELDTRELVELLRRDPRILKDADFEKIVGHFKSKIEQAREAMEERGFGETFHQLIKEILDYRRWFSFTLYYRRADQQKRELTNHAFDTFSGGEKAMAMYIPLFSAAYSRYQEAGPEAPFIISLDEAFAGVDEQNIADMFELMEQLGFNYLINSQALWGDYETVPALSICELIRPQDAPFVSVARYLWNGKRRSLITAEEQWKEALV